MYTLLLYIYVYKNTEYYKYKEFILSLRRKELYS
jgi:hypothetical protein